MKKSIIVILMVALCAFSVFAIDMSVGGNLDFTHAWSSTKTSAGDLWSKEGDVYDLIGINAFFDAKYVRLGLGANFTFAGVSHYTKNSVNANSKTDNKKMSLAYFKASVVGKYPISLGIAAIYPMLGMDFEFNISSKFDGNDLKAAMTEDMKKSLNHYYLVGGLGADVFISKKLFLNPTFLFGYDLKKFKGYKETKNIIEATGAKFSSNNFKFVVGLGVGYKL